MKKRIFILLFFLIAAAFLYSCVSTIYTPVMMNDFITPENAELTVRDIRIKGFTLDWTNASGENYEYAVAASYNRQIEDYQTALENDKIVMDFTPAYILNGTYKVTKLLPGKDYEIKLFVRAHNVKISEYLTAKATLPFLDEAELLNVWINGQEAVYDKTNDSYTHYYLLGQEEEEYAFTYNLMRGCALYINGEKVESEKINLTPYETLEVTVVNERTQSARDYTIYAGGKTNGIPVVIIDTETRLSNDKNKVIDAHMKIIDSEYNPLGIGLYDGTIQMQGRGNSSWGMPKRGYNLELSVKSQILDMAPARDWLIMANYADKSLMRNYTAYEFARDLGAEFSPKMRFVDMIINDEYVGNYLIGERIRVSEGRLDLPEIRKDTKDEYELTGTYVLEINHIWRMRSDEIKFHTKRITPGQYNQWGLVEGDTVVIRQPAAQNLPDGAYEYIKDYFTAAEDAMFSDDFKDPEKGYRAYIDTASFIDWYLINEFYKQVDGDVRVSTFLYKPRGGKLHMGPVWDFDLGAGNADYRTCDDPKGWYIRTAAWFTRLFEDEAFAQEFKERWNELKENGTFDRFFKRIDETAVRIEKSAEMNFQKWDILGEYVWPNANNFWERTTYQSEVDYLKDWLTQRFEWMDYEINSVRTTTPEEETALDKAKYPNVRFGETSDILLLEVEWHTQETYSEYIEEVKAMNIESNADWIKWIEENLRRIDKGRYYEPRLINGKNAGNIFNHRDDQRIDITQFYDENGYYIFRIYPYNIYVTYNDKNGEVQYESFGVVNSKHEYEYVLQKEIIPFCDDLLAKGLLTQEQYEYYTIENLLDIWVDRFFN